MCIHSVQNSILWGSALNTVWDKKVCSSGESSDFFSQSRERFHKRLTQLAKKREEFKKHQMIHWNINIRVIAIFKISLKYVAHSSFALTDSIKGYIIEIYSIQKQILQVVVSTQPAEYAFTYCTHYSVGANQKCIGSKFPISRSRHFRAKQILRKFDFMTFVAEPTV